MPKERSVNPAQAQRKADKQKEIAKGKKQLQAQRNEKLARRNPERLQRQIDELKQLESSRALRPTDKETLAQLEKDVRGIRKAREALGDAAPKFPSHERRERQDGKQEQRERRQQLGKRQREHQSDGYETDPEVRAIPMPRDTPPPIPPQRDVSSQIGPDGKRIPHALPAKPIPPAPAQTVYSSAPQIRDLQKEAVRFMPSVVSQQKNRVKGQGRLLEPDEVEKLEKAGYLRGMKESELSTSNAQHEQDRNPALAHLDDEARRFEHEIGALSEGNTDTKDQRAVRMEEVIDDGT